MKQNLIIAALLLLLGGTIGWFLHPKPKPETVYVKEKINIDSLKLIWAVPRADTTRLFTLLEKDKASNVILERILARFKTRFDQLRDSLDNLTIQSFSVDTSLTTRMQIRITGDSIQTVNEYQDTIRFAASFYGEPLNVFSDILIFAQPLDLQVPLKQSTIFVPAKQLNFWLQSSALWNGNVGTVLQLGYNHVGVGYGLLAESKPIYLLSFRYDF